MASTWISAWRARIIQLYHTARSSATFRRGLWVSQYALGAVVLWWLVTAGNVDLHSILQRLAGLSLEWLILGLLCFVAAMVVGSLRYYLLFAGSISFRYLISVTLLQNALLTFVPWRIGELGFPILLWRDHKIAIASSTAIIVLIRLVDLCIMLAVALAGGGRLGLELYWIGGLLAAGVVILSLGGLALARFCRANVSTLMRTVLSTLAPLGDARRTATVLSLSLALFVLTTMQSAGILWAVGFPVNVFDVGLLNALSLLVALLPIHPPGGWGTADAIQVVILQNLGYSIADATPAILTAHSIYFIVILLGGVTGWILWKSQQPPIEADVVRSLN